MKYPIIRLIFDRRKKSSEDTVGVIEVEITFNRRRKWISTGVSVLPRQWDQAKLIVSHPDRADLLMRIDAVKKPVDEYVKNLMARDMPFTFEGLNGWLEKKSNRNSFIKFVETRIEEQTDLKEATKKAHRKLVSALLKFGKIETFDSLTRSNIMAYDQWLHSKPYTQPTIHSYHKLLRRYTNEALAFEFINHDPYSGVRIERGKSKERKYLTENEIMQIRKCDILPSTLQKVRDLFIFQCYTGLAYADLVKFDFSKVTERNGRYILHDQRQKTQEDYYIVLLNPALEILQKYNFSLPMMTNQQYNMRLKAVADCAGLNKRLSSHMARHSFACLILNHGLPMEIVSRAMGHTNTNTTQIYAKLVNRTVEDAFARLDQTLNSGMVSGC